VSNNTSLKLFGCRNNQLTSLDVSKNTELTEFGCDKNRISRLDVSNNNMLDGLYCDFNILSSDNLNNLFESLHSNPPSSEFWGKRISISGNPGADECNVSIAENKGWIVYK